MAVLHGSWFLQTPDPLAPQSRPKGGLFLWGETWRRLEAAAPTTAIPDYPYAVEPAELLSLIQTALQASQLPDWLAGLRPIEPQRGRKKAKPANATVTPDSTESAWRSHPIGLPTHFGDLLPQLSGSPTHQPEAIAFYPWQVPGLYLQPTVALQLLNRLPLNFLNADDSTVLGGDLRFWSHIARWSLDLLARSKMLPELSEATGNGQWQALLDSSTDRARLKHFSQHMPAICRTYQPNAQTQDLTIALPPEPEALLQNFLDHAIETQILSTSPAQPPDSLTAPLGPWLTALTQPSASLNSTDTTALQPALSTWKTPLRQDQGAQFRVCLQLETPIAGSRSLTWTLHYHLQANDDPDCLVDAALIWQNPVERLTYADRSIEHPQETLLMGLGLASRLYPLLEASLEEARPQACVLEPRQAYELIMNGVWRLRDSGLGVILPASLETRGGWANRLGLKISAKTALRPKKERLGLQSLLNFEWELSIGGQTLSRTEFDRLVAQNTPLVELNGEWVELRSQDIKAAQTFFATRKDQTTLSLEDALRISTGDTQTIEKMPVVSFEASGALQELVTTLTGNQTLAEIPTPETFQGELRPYQARGVSWLTFLERWGLGACLADDMGLGKTIQLIAFLLHLEAQKALHRSVLLICPTSVLGNWEREVKKFAPSLSTIVHHGDRRDQGTAFTRAAKNCHLVITSYALLARDLQTLQTVPWQGIVLDEAQNIKNPEAKQSQAVRQLEADFRIALTGTPVENRLSELWSILDFLNPGYLGPKNFFQRRFAIPIERYGDTTSLQTLRSLTQPFILRRLKTDRDIIQDLPEKQEMTVFCGLSAEQAALYQTLVDRSLETIEAAQGIQRKGIILALLTKLKQLCNHPDLIRSESDAEIELESEPSADTATFRSRSVKLQRLEEMLEEAVSEGDRVLIFTQFAEWGKRLQTHLTEQLGREVLFLYGGTPKKQREAMIDRFQEDPQGPRIFLLSLKAGGVGLNLTRANHVFHYDRWWNPAVENQATDRVFRIGQTKNVQVHKFVCTGTLEERIHEMIEGKKALAEQVVGIGENWLTELDSNQLRDLLLLDRSAVIEE